jgi:dolichyl-phosphate-mannose-protein mannosyltransferase
MRRLALFLAPIAAVLIVYRHAVGAFFFEDDFQWLMTTRFFHPADVLNIGSYSHFYRPVIELYFWAGVALFGRSAALFHAASIAVHAVNGILLFLIVRHLTSNERAGLVAALVFVVLPGYVEAVAWIGALAEPVGAFFGCLAIYAFLKSDAPRGAGWIVLSCAAFALALLTHESSVVFLPILFLVVYAAGRPRGMAVVRALAPFVLVAIAYLAIDIPINRRSYLVGEDLYKPGFHIVTNILSYIVGLYVGKRNAVTYAIVAIVVVALFAFGNRRVRLGTGWMLLALMPFAPFTWGNTSRYLYLPAMGFSILIAEAIEWIDGRLQATRLSPYRTAIVGLIVAAIAIRFMVFASKGVENFAERTDAYRRFLHDLHQQHPQLPPDTQVPIDAKTDAKLHQRFLEAAVQWEYDDPSLRVVVR